MSKKNPKSSKYPVIWIILGIFLIFLVTLSIISTNKKINENEIKDLVASIIARGDIADSVVYSVKETCMPYEIAFEKLDSLESEIDQFESELKELKVDKRIDIIRIITNARMKLQASREEILLERTKEEFGEKEVSPSCAFIREQWRKG